MLDAGESYLQVKRVKQSMMYCIKQERFVNLCGLCKSVWVADRMRVFTVTDAVIPFHGKFVWCMYDL